MTCPKCKSKNTRCIDSRPHWGHVWRSYNCSDCGTRSKTVELPREEYDAYMALAQGIRGVLELEAYK